MSAPSGWLVIDKPVRMTSRDVVNRVQTRFPRRTPIGHTGTLDPLATGVLVLAVGAATRLAEYVQALGKVYETEFTLGATSATDDAEGPITPTPDAAAPDRTTVEAALHRFIGVIEQVPPAFSAVQVDGKRAYRQARAGAEVVLAARTVRIDAIRLFDYDYPRMKLEVRCGKGTYIRSLARDLGALLGCGGYVSQLQRIAVGDFTVAEAVDLDSENVTLSPLERGVAALPRLDIPASAVTRLINGAMVDWHNPLPPGTEAAAFAEGRLIAIVVIQADATIWPVKVLASR
ncbi:MAG: tRNA pseudouridine(55) synthase TruB [Gemmataceae bacterium]